jgi:hypothetical protein
MDRNYGLQLMNRKTGFTLGCVSSAEDPNLGSPHLRHAERSNVAFVEGHLEALKASKWYWSGTPWLKPAEGGNQ